MEAVIAEFIKADKLKEFLLQYGDEVVEMETLDFTYERRVELVKKAYYDDGFNDGQNLGLQQGIEALIIDNLDEGKTEEQIISKVVKRFDLTRNIAKEYVDKYAATHC